MLESSIDIGHYARVPYHIATAKISSRARDVWTLLAMHCTPESPEVWIRQATLACQLNCSTDTIGRATQELIRKRLLVPTQKWHQGRFKFYILVWESIADLRDDLPQPCGTPEPTYLTNAVAPSAIVRVDVSQKCGPLNRILTKQEQNIYFKKAREEFLNPEQEAQKLLVDWGDVWKKRFLCLDGLSGRPSVETCVEQALNHSSRQKYANSKIHVEVWLQNAARDWALSFNRELNAPSTDPALGPEAKARRSQAESERSKKYYSQSTRVPEFKAKPIPAELQDKIDQVMANQQPGWVEILRKLMKDHEQPIVKKLRRRIDNAAHNANTQDL